jgi:branched-chain amino acid transport system substrate-binding protein
MKKAALLLAAVFVVFPLLAASNLPVITVLDFRTNNVSAGDMRSIISLLSSALFKTGRFEVIDVAQRDTLLKELEFSVSQCLEESCQLSIGKMLSAQQIVVGDIARVGSRYMMSAKILLTETAATVASADGIYPTMDALVDDLYRVASALAGVGGTTTAQAATAAAPMPAGASGPLRIALLVPITGAVAGYGVSARDGALLAISECNARGGVRGRRIEPVVADGRCEAAAAEEEARRLLRDGIRFLIGEVCSTATIPVARIVNDSGALLISPTSTNPAVTVDPSTGTLPFVFRACFIDSFQGTAAAAYAGARMKARTAFVLSDPSNTYSAQLADAFEASFRKRGGRILGSADSREVQGSTSPLLVRVKRANPDMIYLPEYVAPASRILRAARAAGITRPFLGADGWASEDMDLAAADGCAYTDHSSPMDPRPEAVAFRKAYGAAYKNAAGAPRETDSIAALSYDAANILLAAIQAAGSEDPADVKGALERIRFSGVTGEISFDASHNPVKPAALITIRAGKREFAGSFSP